MISNPNLLFVATGTVAAADAADDVRCFADVSRRRLEVEREVEQGRLGVDGGDEKFDDLDLHAVGRQRRLVAQTSQQDVSARGGKTTYMCVRSVFG